MTREEIEHLSKLARIRLSEDEAKDLAKDIGEVLSYVGVLKEIAGDVTTEKKVGPLHTIMREDTDPHPAAAYTEDLLKEAPDRDRNYIRVKKILGEA